jgi:hypothetical protein
MCKGEGCGCESWCGCDCASWMPLGENESNDEYIYLMDEVVGVESDDQKKSRACE